MPTYVLPEDLKLMNAVETASKERLDAICAVTKSKDAMSKLKVIYDPEAAAVPLVDDLEVAPPHNEWPAIHATFNKKVAEKIAEKVAGKKPMNKVDELETVSKTAKDRPIEEKGKSRKVTNEASAEVAVDDKEVDVADDQIDLKSPTPSPMEAIVEGVKSVRVEEVAKEEVAKKKPSKEHLKKRRSRKTFKTSHETLSSTFVSLKPSQTSVHKDGKK